MSAHTPGAWTFRYAADGSGDIGIVADGGCVAEVFHEIRCRGEGARDEQSANARLIAAAPELLAELQRVYDSLCGECFDWWPVRVAIAKATGGAA